MSCLSEDSKRRVPVVVIANQSTRGERMAWNDKRLEELAKQRCLQKESTDVSGGF